MIATNMPIKFKSPPINEVGIGVYFDPLKAMRAEHIGLFWADIRNNFPEVQQVLPYIHDHVQADFAVKEESFSLPRFWFIAEDETYAIQIQQNMFMLNWRKKEQTYPHFAAIKKKFDQYYQNFRKFCQQYLKIDALKISVCELFYVNTIDDISSDEARKFIPSCQMLDAGITDSRKSVFAITQKHDLQNGINIELKLNSAQNRDTKKDVLILNLKATGLFSDSETENFTIDQWFADAHAILVESFIQLTDEDVQKNQWGRENV